MQLGNLQKIISRFPELNILVIGDLILDEYIWGSVDRISPEAPVPVIWANKRSFVPGGAANVANNISSLGGKVTLIGVVGKDKNTDILLAQIKERNISTDGIFVESNRHTTLKSRIIAGHQQIARVDWEHREALSSELNARIIRFIEKNIRNYNGLIIEDYGKGVINACLLKEIIKLAAEDKKVVTVDPKEENFLYYRGVSSITPNRRELENAVRNLRIKDKTNRFKAYNDRLFDDKEIDSAARQILKYLNLESILVTLGEEGMRLFEKNGNVVKIPTVAQEVFDVSGAGDTVIAVFTLSLSGGAAKPEAAYISNFAAGIVVGKLGTATLTREELQSAVSSQPSAFSYQKKI